MSGREYTPGTDSGQVEVTRTDTGTDKIQGNPDTRENRIAIANLRMQIGVLTRSDLALIFDCSPQSVHVWVKEWLKQGLVAFRPGTGSSLFLRSDVEQFLKNKPTFRGRRVIKKPTRKRRTK